MYGVVRGHLFAIVVVVVVVVIFLFVVVVVGVATNVTVPVLFPSVVIVVVLFIVVVVEIGFGVASFVALLIDVFIQKRILKGGGGGRSLLGGRVLAIRASTIEAISLSTVKKFRLWCWSRWYC